MTKNDIVSYVIAVPGPFLFCADVPEELIQAAQAMNMGVEFGIHAFGFERTLS